MNEKDYKIHSDTWIQEVDYKLYNTSYMISNKSSLFNKKEVGIHIRKIASIKVYSLDLEYDWDV